MGRDVSFEQAAKFAMAALAKMQELQIPQSPRNFTVWYHYASNDLPDLVAVLDHLLERGQAFTPEKNEELFRRFFPGGEMDAVMTTAAGRLSLELGSLIDKLEAAGENTARYGDALEAFGDSLKTATKGEPAGLAEIVAGMLAATRVMEKRNHDLEERLNASSQQVLQLRDELESRTREALTDPLTGLANRKKFDQEMERLAAESAGGGGPLVLLVIDIDHFKRFNDSHGHVVGDQVLKLLGATLRDGIKGRDVAARYGGEEFVILLPATAMPDAAMLAEALRETVRKKRILNRSTGKDLGEITVSIGLGCYRPGEPLADFFTRADQALYQAKREGRNRVVSEDKTAAADAA